MAMFDPSHLQTLCESSTLIVSLPCQIFLRNRLKYALTGREVSLIVKQRLVKVDNKVRTDETYPAGFMGQSAMLHQEQE